MGDWEFRPRIGNDQLIEIAQVIANHHVLMVESGGFDEVDP